MNPRPSHRLAGVAALALALVVGCSGEDGSVAPATSTPTTSAAARTGTPGTTAGEVFGAARTAALAAGSGRVTGTVRHEGEALDIDVEGVADGSNQRVLITTEDGGTSEVVTIDGSYWLGGDEAFWVAQTGDAAAGREMVGKYVSIDESAATELGSYSLRGVVTAFFSHPQVAALEGDTTSAERTEVEGRPAYLIGEEGGARLWVAADGSGTVLRAEGPAGAPTDLVFSDWERARTFEPPPASSVVEG